LYNIKQYSLSDSDLKRSVDISVQENLLSDSGDVIIDKLLSYKPDVLGLSCYLWSTRKLLDIAEKMMKVNPALKVIVGGPDTSTRAKLLLDNNPQISAIVEGEGEETFRLFLRRLIGLESEDWENTPGLTYKEKGKIVANPRPEPVNMDSIPICIEDPQFVESYGYWLYLETSRGCRYKCAYCTYHQRGYKWRTRSLENVIAAIDKVRELNGTHLSFIDAGFNQDKARFRTVLKYIASYPQLKLDGMETSIEDTDEEDVFLLAKVSKGRIATAIQSTNPAALKIMGRRHRPEIFKNRTEILLKCGKDFSIDLIFGLPGDNYEGFKNSIDDAYSYQPTRVYMFPLSMLPGSRFERESKKYGFSYSKEPPYLSEFCTTFPKDQMIKATTIWLAHALLNTLSFSSETLQISARELGKKPSELLESFVQGEWRKKAFDMDELAELKDPALFEERVSLVDAFVKYEFSQAGYDAIPRQMLDLLMHQYSFGRITANYLTGKGVVCDSICEWPPKQHTKPVKSNLVQTMECETDITKLTRYKSTLAEAAVKPHILLIHRTHDAIKKVKISETVNQLINYSDGKSTMDEIIEKMLSKMPPKDLESNKKKLVKAFEDLTKRGILIWK
jgi:radical SAM superfamily enzyme YgiQ (UPF0313 family)